MSFPPLPPATVDEHNLQGGRLLYTHQQIRAYGQQCREQALEEAAMASEDGFKYALDGYQIADKIRSLKS